MNRNGEVIIIEDDDDDRMILEEIFEELPYSNSRRYFNDGESALAYLSGEFSPPFIILSDINLPKLDGMALRNKLKNNASLNLKCIPYLFFTTASNKETVIDAYSASAQGFFIKPPAYEELRETIRYIMEYWKRCTSPNNF